MSEGEEIILNAAASALEPYDASKDSVPGLILGIQAMLGTAWWIVGMFTYIKNNSNDANLQTIAGVDTFPILWWWERLGEKAEEEETTPKYQWIAFSLFF